MSFRRIVLLCSSAGALSTVLTFGAERATAGEPQVAGQISGAASRSRNAAVFRPAAGDNFRVLHSFGSGEDGSKPHGEMIVDNGVLYGTTDLGGTGGAGTVFALTPAGVESVLYNFKSVPDGAEPLAALTAFDGALFGTTADGGGTCNGSAGSGTVFELSAAGAENVVAPFGCTAGGLNPRGKLLSYNGALYGTTFGGGAGKNGTVFVLRPGGTKKVIYSFQGAPDAARPLAGLVEIGGVLYGTTQQGGTSNDGAVFAITPTGTEHVLHSFSGKPGDGSLPDGPLIVVDGALFGTTSYGGPVNEGTVFSLSTSGTETVLYAFGDPPDSNSPSGRLVFLNGFFYGTANGGTSNGTVFKLDMAGKETILHNFTLEQGYDLEDGLTVLNGMLYGTATQGGANRKGTIFELAP